MRVDGHSEPNRYSVHAGRGEHGWEVRILDPRGEVAFSRACAGEAEARSFASTVNQHVDWLSEEKFREYYRLST